MLRLKEGVQIAGLRREMQKALDAAAAAFDRRSVDCVVTSALDGKHKEGSLHYVGHALDFRTFHINFADRERLAKELRDVLGSDFDVVNEPDHLHVEFDPKIANV